ncbi:nucleotidyltransferase domain-containing protein [Candidatus Pacearchaeota archaeon]|nr:nucleotidyltransferase domain-containing protein [Candidatus Pacearchaeota archaeon]
MKKEFWTDWENKSKIEIKGIKVVRKARNLILKNIPNEEIIGIYSKGSFPRREINAKSDIDLMIIIRHSRFLKKFKKIEKANKISLGFPIHLAGVSLFELKKGVHCKSGDKEGKSTSRIVKQLPNYKLIYGKGLGHSNFPVRSNKEDLKKLIGFYKTIFIPSYKNKKVGFSEIVKGTFWLVEDEQRFNGKEFSTSWKDLARSIKNKNHIVHETLKLRLRPTKNKKIRQKFLKRLEKYILRLENKI